MLGVIAVASMCDPMRLWKARLPLVLCQSGQRLVILGRERLHLLLALGQLQRCSIQRSLLLSQLSPASQPKRAPMSARCTAAWG